MTRGIILTALALVADAAWVTVGLSVVGWALGQGASLLPYWVAFAVLGGGFAAGRLAPTYAYADGARLDGGWRSGQALAGALCAYAATAAGPAAGEGITLSWPWRLATGELGTGDAVAIVIGLPLVLLLWRRGVTSGLEGMTRDRLHSAFRIAIAVLAFAAVADAACGCGMLDYRVVGVLLPASLAALALGQLPPADAKAARWLRVVAAAVALVLGAGLAGGYLGGAYGQGAAAAAGRAWRALVTGLIDVVAFLLGPVLRALFRLVEWLRSLVTDSGERIRPPSLRPLDGLLPTDIAALDAPIRAVVQLVLLALLAWILYRGLLLGFRSRFRRLGSVAGDAREAILDDRQPVTDLAELLLGLLPRWLRHAARGAGHPRYPADEPGITEAFDLYFDMLDAARARGWRLDGSMTPLERVDVLERVLGGTPVQEITGCFNDACYGETATDLHTLSRLRGMLHRAGPTSRGTDPLPP